MVEMTIGQIARKSGVKTDTIRYYETLKLIEPVGRTNAGYRLYDTSSTNRIVFIKRAKALGFKLTEIQKFLEIQASNNGTAEEMLNLTNNKIVETQKNIEDLMAMKKTLESIAADCPGGDLPLRDCPISLFLHRNQKKSEVENGTKT